MTEEQFYRAFGPVKGMHFHPRVSNIIPTDDAFIMNSLVRCRVGSPTIFSLLWGDYMADRRCFPSELRKTVTDIILEEQKKEKSYDPEEKKLHSIIIDLLYVMYEKQVDDIVGSSFD